VFIPYYRIALFGQTFQEQLRDCKPLLDFLASAETYHAHRYFSGEQVVMDNFPFQNRLPLCVQFCRYYDAPGVAAFFRLQGEKKWSVSIASLGYDGAEHSPSLYLASERDDDNDDDPTATPPAMIARNSRPETTPSLTVFMERFHKIWLDESSKYCQWLDRSCALWPKPTKFLVRHGDSYFQLNGTTSATEDQIRHLCQKFEDEDEGSVSIVSIDDIPSEIREDTSNFYTGFDAALFVALWMHTRRIL
jgi:hypothetical protein